MSHAERGLRDEWGDCLVRLGSRFANMVVLDGDVGPATKADRFAAAFPKRYVQFGCAEQNVVSAAAGMASFGLMPVLSLFACFCSKRAADQVALSVALPRLNVKLCGSYAGLTTPNTGPTHQSVDDVNIMRGMPNMIVLEAADAMELEQIMEACLLYDGPTYVRIVRCPLERVSPEGYRFKIGRAAILRAGKDITLLGAGLMVSRCLAAADLLASRGISAEVINVSSIKPIDAETIVSSVVKTGRALTAENHSIIGGLGSAVAEILGEYAPRPLRRVGINDRFGTSGQLNSILEAYGLTAANVAEQAEQLIK